MSFGAAADQQRGEHWCSMRADAAQTDLLLGHERAHASSDALEQRLASVVETYDRQGNHRSGTDVDYTSAEWLVGCARRLGVEAALEPFALDRIDPQWCFLRVADRCIGGVPLFDAALTGSDGVHGRLGALGSDAEIALAETEPFTLMEPLKELGGAVAAARRSRHKAIVLLTRGSRSGLFLLNALSFMKPCGPPMLQVSSVESAWLKEQAAARAHVTLVTAVRRTATQAFNVTATIAGSDPGLPPLVIMTPRSGWWQCASERGGGLACWLEAMRALARGKPARDCLFLACSGHELGFLGLDAYLDTRPDLIRRACQWIHFGANIGSPRQPNLVLASDDAVERWAVGLMAKEGLTASATAGRGQLPRGEAGALHRGGGRYVAVVCGTEVFHHAADRWPDAVDVPLLARYARAFANGALQLAAGDAATG
jgi:hypothetical protein